MAERLGQLLRKCRDGDDAAVTLLVRRFRTRALDLAGALTGDDHLAEDAVQTAFLDALARLDDLREPEAFPGWFRQIVRTRCNRIVRRKREHPTPEIAESATDAQGSPFDDVERRERVTVVRAALALLPADQRETAERFYLADQSCADIADRMNVPRGTVKRRLHDVRHRLRGMLLGYVSPTGQRPARDQRSASLPL